jgi:crotonobetainyl-CoA:carnitine CoA-transferase CaiB-like acyl-CoA transferase
MILEEENSEFLLGPYRVLDLTDQKGWLAGKLLADLGAEVIKIEKPGGDPGRNIGPFYHNVPDPEKSLNWFAFNTNKKSITLDIETTDGQEIFKVLARKARFIIESFPPGYMDRRGLGYDVLSSLNPEVILTSISDFGQNGPYQGYKGSDLVDQAMSGVPFQTGDDDRPPLQLPGNQAYQFASLQAGMGTLLAHIHRQVNGKGQHVDVSVQESLSSTNLYAIPYWYSARRIMRRSGAKERRMNVSYRLVYPCKDGFVTARVMVGRGFGALQKRLVEVMDSRGMAEDLKNMHWTEFSLDTTTQEDIDHWEEVMGKFFSAHTKNELHEMAKKHALAVVPVFNAKTTPTEGVLGGCGIP